MQVIWMAWRIATGLRLTLRRAVTDVFDQPVIERCQLHRVRNVRDKLPDKLRTAVERRMRDAYHAGTVVEAEAKLTALAP